jgi:hypothetical protein
VSHSRVVIAAQTANGWVGRAEPIIREYLELDQMHARLLSSLAHARDTKNARYLSVAPLEEAARVAEKAAERFGGMIDAIREDHIADEYFHTDAGASAETEERNIADNEAVNKAVASVKEATDAVAEQILKGA